MVDYRQIRSALSRLTRVWVILGIVILVVSSGCQVTTHTGMYRAYVPWRRFREFQFVLERAPVKDEEPGLWGPRLKTHALKWHDQEYGDARYVYTPRSSVTQTSAAKKDPVRVAEVPRDESLPSGSNRPARLPENSSAPPSPPPGDSMSLPDEDGAPPTFIEEGEETPQPVPTEDDPVAGSNRRPFVPGRTISKEESAPSFPESESPDSGDESESEI